MGRGVVVKLLFWIVAFEIALVAASDGDSDGRSGERDEPEGTIAFASVGRAHFAYDLFEVGVPDSLLKATTLRSSNAEEAILGTDLVSEAEFLHETKLTETKLTDGVSVNYNGQYVGTVENGPVLDRVRKGGVNVLENSKVVIFVSERNGSSRIYFNIHDKTDEEEILGPVTVDSALRPFEGPVLFDRPSVAGGNIVFVSTVDKVESRGQSWAAVYSAELKKVGGIARRLTPEGFAEFSPSVSPSGEWVVAASIEGDAYKGELEELPTDLYLYRSKDGSDRSLLIKRGGWPTWGGDRTIFFHRKADDGWWSVFRIIIPEDFFSSGGAAVQLQEERITPPEVHAFTPAASRTGKWVAVATRRPGSSEFRHVEIFDLTTQSFVSLTENISPTKHHYNPFVSPDSGSVGYHRCRGNPGGATVVPRLQRVQSPFPGLALVRVDGTFPVISPDGKLLAYVRNVDDNSLEIPKEEAGVYVMNVDGSNERKVFSGSTFALAWNPKREGVLYASVGPIFKSKRAVQIIALGNVHREDLNITYKQLTKSGNNAFPSPSPDGERLVFRSKRSGYKNLYIMDADGEEKGLERLTEGPWLDQHPNWSPSGDWIAFVSNRENPKVGTFGRCSIYLIRPDKTELHKVVESSERGLTVHPTFSPDGKKLVFVSDLAGISAEPVSEPHMFQPYGEIFTANVDGSNIQRLTHNFVEDGTPSWSRSFLSPTEITHDGQLLSCNVEDTQWLKNVTTKMLSSHYLYLSAHERQSCPHIFSEEELRNQEHPFV